MPGSVIIALNIIDRLVESFSVFSSFFYDKAKTEHVTIMLSNYQLLLTVYCVNF